MLFRSLIGDFAKGKDGMSIDLIMVGSDIDKEYLSRKVSQAEKMVGRKVNCKIIEPSAAKNNPELLNAAESLVLWSNGGS